MKLLLLFVALVGFVRADSAEDLAAANLFIKCVDKALNEGLPSIPIPVHNPLVIRNISYNTSNVIFDFEASITNNILYNLMDYNITINATSYSNPEKVNFDYDIYWPLLNFTGDYEIVFHSIITEDIKGTYNIVLHHTDWYGIFNLTKPGQEDQGIKEHLDEFSLASSVKEVEVSLTGALENVITDEALKLAVLTVFNNFPTSLADILKDSRINEFWIDHPERIDAVIANCQ